MDGEDLPGFYDYVLYASVITNIAVDFLRHRQIWFVKACIGSSSVQPRQAG